MADSSLSEAQSTAIADALRRGNKIEAIKLHREATESGLRDAKEAVEAIETGLRVQHPETFRAPEPARGNGCLGLVALGALAGLTGAAWWWPQG